ncbi:MAG: hypothetical protein A2Y07_08750 [Planctomycetes bacterium GWF2_50_10]|nr:MAG: hypothetical protein A2Y07_08750 [Planctomycetes bacterium GWF2_50_10]
MIKRLVNSCLGLGFMPVAPGTWGSLPVAIIFGLLVAGGASATKINVIMMGLMVIGSVACVCYAPASIQAKGRKDPGEVVMDEFAGQAVTFLTLRAIVPVDAFTAAAAGFILFRIFDITKPWIIRKLEVLPAGWGILADDLGAGIAAAIVLNVLNFFGGISAITSMLPHSGNISIFDGAVLGVIQGLTEFLPVSSDGHLTLMEYFFGFQAESDQMLSFDLMLHLGTVVAIFFVFRNEIVEFGRSLWASRKLGLNPVTLYKKSYAVHILILAFVANVATAVIGLPLEDKFQAARGDLWVVAAMWVITGAALVVTDFRKRARISLRDFGVIAAVLVGMGQAFALMPAISRSGMTICAAVLYGLHRKWAVEFSFLVGIPAILGATAIKFYKEFDTIQAAGFTVGSVVVGPIVAAAVGIIALELLISTTRKAKLKYFGFYCWLLAAGLGVYLLSKA